MKLVGSCKSGYARRVAITLKLLELEHEHLPLNAMDQRDLIHPFSPMIKIPVLVLDDEVLIDSSSIIDFLHELVGPERALIPASGIERRTVLRYVSVALAVYEKICIVFSESRRPVELQMDSITAGAIEQILAGFAMLEAAPGASWLASDRLTQADIMAVICYQSALWILPAGQFDVRLFPRLARLEAIAGALPAFATSL